MWAEKSHFRQELAESSEAWPRLLGAMSKSFWDTMPICVVLLRLLGAMPKLLWDAMSTVAAAMAFVGDIMPQAHLCGAMPGLRTPAVLAAVCLTSPSGSRKFSHFKGSVAQRAEFCKKGDRLQEKV